MTSTTHCAQDVAHAAASIGRKHGAAAASWVFDGSTPDETYAAVLAGIEDCDPAIMDAYRTPDLSGGIADSYTSRDLAADLGIDADDESGLADAEAAYLDAADGAFWSELDRTCREHLASSLTEQLRDAGFPVRYAFRPDEGQEYIVWHDLSDYRAQDSEPYADLSRIARGEDRAGQVSTIDRSNFRSLLRDYPGTFTPVSYADCDTLGAFVADLTPELVTILTGLAEQYPLYDESDLSELEAEEISDSYEQYARADAESLLPDAARDRWDAMAPTAQRDLFWDVVSGHDLYPEHDGRDVCWRYEELAAALAAALA